MDMQNCYAGQINLFARPKPTPTNWILCQGQCPMVKDHEVLFQAIGYTFGKQESPFGEAFKLPGIAPLNKVNYFINGQQGIDPQGTLGEIVLFCEDAVPENWLKCDGQLLSIEDNLVLHELIGGKFGHNGTSFALPNLPPPADKTVYAMSSKGNLPYGGDVNSYKMEGTIAAVQWFPCDKNYEEGQWYLCNGQSLSIPENQLLYSQIGDTYGGSGGSFCVPNMEGPAMGINYIICAQGIMPQG
ncbi:MAG: tail fiber protein [Fluviicola sp.]